MHDDVAILARQGKGDLALEIEMLLAADRELGAEQMRRRLERGIGITAQHRRRRLDIGLGGERRLDVEDGCFGVDLDRRALGRVARRVETRRHHQRQRLAGIEDAVGREQRLVAADRGDVVLAGNVLRTKHRDDTRCRRDLDLLQPAMRDRAQHQRGMQRSRRLRHVVDVDRLAGGVLQRRIVAQRAVRAALHRASTSTGRCGSARRSSSRRSRLAATCRR
jgi:hypothetical protein